MSSRAEQFHASPWIGALFITGGGSKLIEEQLSTPGASASILEVQVPYATRALDELLGRAPEQACSETTARQLAIAAFERAQHLQPDPHNFGLGCTASLATNRTKQGQHRAFWAIQTSTTSTSFSATFSSDRATEELALVEHLWQSLQHVLLNVDPEADSDTDLSATLNMQHCDANASQLALYEIKYEGKYEEEFEPELGKYSTVAHDGLLILPGSFNPLHAGHQQMMRVGEDMTGLTGAYELTIKNADKPKLDFLTLNERLTQFRAPLWITNAATYAEKAKLFPQTTFLLGVDTMARIAELRFYDDRSERMHEAIATFHDQETKFLVFGRQADRYITLADLELPETLRSLCTEVPEATFRMDISSTELRNG